MHNKYVTMYNICMNSYYEPSELKRLIKQLKLNQDDLVGISGVSQGQVSRIISGKFKKPGEAYKRICIYVFNALNTDTRKNVEENKLILDALAEVWDGTDEQAKSLAQVIRSLGPLCSKGNL